MLARCPHCGAPAGQGASRRQGQCRRCWAQGGGKALRVALLRRRGHRRGKGRRRGVQAVVA